MFQRSVFCIASSQGRADLIIVDLRAAKFTKHEISVLFLDQRVAAAKASGGTEATAANPAAATSAGEIRGILGWIAGITPLVLPDVAPLISAGPIALALRGATGGGIAGGLVSFGLPHAEAGRYESRIKDGHVLVSIHITNADRGDRAREIFAAAGADEIFTMVDVTPPQASLLRPHGMVRRHAA